MVKRNVINIILFNIIIFCFSSCCVLGDYYVAKLEDGSMGGLRSMCLYKKYISKRINPEIIGIKTDIIYKNSGYYKNDLYLNKSYKGFYYYHFYKNGTGYSFYEKKDNKIDSTYFNPKKGNLCFIIKDKSKYWLVQYSVGNAGSFSKIEIQMKQDTLITYKKVGLDKYKFYKEKIKVPKKWLDWKPDY